MELSNSSVTRRGRRRSRTRLHAGRSPLRVPGWVLAAQCGPRILSPSVVPDDIPLNPVPSRTRSRGCTSVVAPQTTVAPMTAAAGSKRSTSSTSSASPRRCLPDTTCSRGGGTPRRRTKCGRNAATSPSTPPGLRHPGLRHRHHHHHHHRALPEASVAGIQNTCPDRIAAAARRSIRISRSRIARTRTPIVRGPRHHRDQQWCDASPGSTWIRLWRRSQLPVTRKPGLDTFDARVHCNGPVTWEPAPVSHLGGP